MSVIKSFCSAFLMYSRIPVPQVEWTEKNRRFSLCFFPLIGVVIGILTVLWFELCRIFQIGTLLFSTVSAAIPIFVTGGIHIDGFCDVCDAKACFGDRKKMLDVMSDPHVGAFAVLGLIAYELIQVGMFSEIKNVKLAAVVSLCYVMSRAWSGFAAVTFKAAKKQGALYSFSKPAHKNITVISELLYIAAAGGIMVYLLPVGGLFALLGGAGAFLYYKNFSYKKFGGITGDLAGYFLQICEIVSMSFAIISETVLGVIT